VRPVASRMERSLTVAWDVVVGEVLGSDGGEVGGGPPVWVFRAAAVGRIGKGPVAFIMREVFQGARIERHDLVFQGLGE